MYVYDSALKAAMSCADEVADTGAARARSTTAKRIMSKDTAIRIILYFRLEPNWLRMTG